MIYIQMGIFPSFSSFAKKKINFQNGNLIRLIEIAFNQDNVGFETLNNPIEGLSHFAFDCGWAHGE